jgi:hypothetical protein
METTCPILQLGPSTLLHRECGHALERIQAFPLGPSSSRPGLMCWFCSLWIPLDILARNIRLYGRWGGG